VLAGPGGVGKSTIARELIRQIQAEATTELETWWLSGSSRSTIGASLVGVGQQLGASEPDLRAIAEQAPDGPDRLWRMLERAPRRWLLVIDNADDSELLAPPSPPPRASERSSPRHPKVPAGSGPVAGAWSWSRAASGSRPAGARLPAWSGWPCSRTGRRAKSSSTWRRRQATRSRPRPWAGAKACHGVRPPGQGLANCRKATQGRVPSTQAGSALGARLGRST
jgi:hypothetical protein